MAWTIAKSLFSALVSLAFATVIVRRATSTFEAAAFVAALIAFHRLQFQISGNGIAGLIGRMRAELWFHRLDFRLRKIQGETAQLPSVLQDVDLYDAFRNSPDLFDENEQLDDFKKGVETFERNAKVGVFISALTELALVGVLLYVLFG